jgi:DNA topoisomerase-1
MAITLGIPCPVCKVGEMTQKQSRYGRVFFSCNKWPNCNFALWDKPLNMPCPKCKFPLLTEKITKRAGLMHKCPNKAGECDYIEVIDPNYGKEPLIETKEPGAVA